MPASDAGRSVGGIYGKAAAQALTPDNQVAELYDPAVLGKEQSRRRFNPDGKRSGSHQSVRGAQNEFAAVFPATVELSFGIIYGNEMPTR